MKVKAALKKGFGSLLAVHGGFIVYPADENFAFSFPHSIKERHFIFMLEEEKK